MAASEQSDKQLLVLCQVFYPELIGTGRTLTELCCDMADMGWNTEVVCAAPTLEKTNVPTPSLLFHHNIKIRRVWATRFGKPNIIERVVNQVTFTISVMLYLIFRSKNRKILVLTNPPFLSLACLIAKLFRPKLKYALLVFDVYPETAINLGLFPKGSLAARIWDWFNLKSFAHAGKIVVIGRCMKEVILSKGRAGKMDLQAKMELIHVWCDDQAIRNAPLVYPSLYAKNSFQNKFIVLYAGNMGRSHDIETILTAALALKEHPRIRFVFVGEGAKKQIVIDFIKNNGLANCVVDGYVPKEELGSLLRCANVGIASLLSGQEGLSVPSKTLGLMAAGIPILAIMNANAEIALLTSEFDLGVVVEPGSSSQLVSAIERLEASPELCRSLGEHGPALIDDSLSLAKAAERYSSMLGAL